MGKLANVFLGLAAVALITIGLAAQTGTISFRSGGSAAPHGHVLGAGTANPTTSPVVTPPASPSPSSKSTTQAAPVSSAGGDEGDNQDGGD